jgi:hypothetical protein
MLHLIFHQLLFTHACHASLFIGPKLPILIHTNLPLHAAFSVLLLLIQNNYMTHNIFQFFTLYPIIYFQRNNLNPFFHFPAQCNTIVCYL